MKTINLTDNAIHHMTNPEMPLDVTGVYMDQVLREIRRVISNDLWKGGHYVIDIGPAASQSQGTNR